MGCAGWVCARARRSLVSRAVHDALHGDRVLIVAVRVVLPGVADLLGMRRVHSQPSKHPTTSRIPPARARPQHLVKPSEMLQSPFLSRRGRCISSTRASLMASMTLYNVGLCKESRVSLACARPYPGATDVAITFRYATSITNPPSHASVTPGINHLASGPPRSRHLSTRFREVRGAIRQCTCSNAHRSMRSMS